MKLTHYIQKKAQRYIDKCISAYINKNQYTIARDITEGLLYSSNLGSTWHTQIKDNITNIICTYCGNPAIGTRLGDWMRQTTYEVIPEIKFIQPIDNWENNISPKSLIQPSCCISESSVGDYTYGAMYGHISQADIGKFCSLGPNLIIGWGIHPTNGISTSPMFYSTLKQNGFSLSKTDKIQERKRITIGNDVFIGANVTVLDGVTIGDGAIIGAGAIVSKDIPPYAIAVGNPIKIIRYRYDNKTIEELLSIRWWDFKEDNLKLIEHYFFDVESFIRECKKL